MKGIMARVDQALFYENSIKKHGKNARGVAWSDSRRQRVRFKALLDAAGDIGQAVVVDAGCGFGDLCLYMVETGKVPKRYIGIDLLDFMVKEARRRTKERVLRRDILKDPLPQADWYFVSGSFNLLTRFETVLAVKRCLDASGRGIVFNLLEGRYEGGRYNYWRPSQIKKACGSFGNVEIFSGYLDGDFTVKITL